MWKGSIENGGSETWGNAKVITHQKHPKTVPNHQAVNSSGTCPSNLRTFNKDFLEIPKSQTSEPAACQNLLEFCTSWSPPKPSFPTTWEPPETSQNCKFHASSTSVTLQTMIQHCNGLIVPTFAFSGRSFALDPNMCHNNGNNTNWPRWSICQFVSKLVKFVLSDLWGCLHFSIYQFSRICLLVILVSMKLQVWMIAPFFLERPAEALSKGCRLLLQIDTCQKQEFSFREGAEAGLDIFR